MLTATAAAFSTFPSTPTRSAALEPTLTTIREAGAADHESIRALHDLTAKFGPRLTGSPATARALGWARREMTQVGLTHVHLEEWTLARAWRRGPAQASLIRPNRQPLTITAYGWSGSTHGRVEGDLLAVDAEEVLKNPLEDADAWRGKILFVTSVAPARALRDYSRLSALARAAAAAGALAVVRHNPRPGPLTHVEPLSFPVSPAMDDASIAVVDLASDQNRMIADALAAGSPVRMQISVKNTFANRARSANVIGDIRGSEHPEQMVIVAAHLDSWDLATGATDDGFGVAAVLGAAATLVKSPVPRRSIRFVLFTGEEQGLLGSRAYVETHRPDLDDVVCALAVDWGSGPVTTLPVAGHAELIPTLEQFAAAADASALSVSDGYLLATDAYSFSLAGLPGIALFQESPDYSAVAHSAADTQDRVDPRILSLDATMLAELAYWLADQQARPGSRFSPQATADALTHGGQRQPLEDLRLWPFVETPAGP